MNFSTIKQNKTDFDEFNLAGLDNLYICVIILKNKIENISVNYKSSLVPLSNQLSISLLEITASFGVGGEAPKQWSGSLGSTTSNCWPTGPDGSMLRPDNRVLLEHKTAMHKVHQKWIYCLCSNIISLENGLVQFSFDVIPHEKSSVAYIEYVWRARVMVRQ